MTEEARRIARAKIARLSAQYLAQTKPSPILDAARPIYVSPKDAERYLTVRFTNDGIKCTMPYEANPARQIPNPESQRDQTPALGGTDEGETPGVRRTRIRFTGFRVKPLDPDNFAGSCKDLLDGCRHAGLILGDESWRIIFETTQKKVRSFAEEKTLIEIET